MLVAQKTIFYKIEEEFCITFIEDGYHIYALIEKNEIEHTDTIFCYKYGAYLGTKIKEAALFDDIFICIYEGIDGMFFSNHKLERNRWTPNVGGYLFFFAQGEKHDHVVSIVTREKFEVRKGTRKKLYLFDHKNKTVSVIDE